MNSLLIFFGIESWKPVLTALLLPPVPLLLMMLIGARLILPRRGLGWLIILTSAALLWLSACIGTARALSKFVLHPPAALSADRIKELKSQAKAPIAIMVLGGGIEPYAPEYGVSNLQYRSLERLRYGLWLGRETGLPVGFSGGVGWGQSDGTPEARIASQIAVSEFSRPLKWIEESSRDTRENAGRSVALLRKAGIKHIVLVTHGFHMPRAIAVFREAAAGDMSIEAAPMGLAQNAEVPALSWIPTAEGTTDVRAILRELLGRAAGA
ncbi:MAG: YdcF family protein [Burkholderiales bacterium]